MGRMMLFVIAVLSTWAGSISGVVLDVTGSVIPRSKIVITGEDGNYTSVTTENGRFVVRGVRPGTYSMEISSPGFSVKTIKSISVLETEVALPPIELAIAVTASCGPFPPVGLFTPIASRRPQLAGRVFLGGNTRAAGVLVSLYDTKSSRKIASARTDAEGNFLINELRPGFYRLKINLSSYAELVVDAVELKRGFRSDAEYFSLTPCARDGVCPAVKWASQALCL